MILPKNNNNQGSIPRILELLGTAKSAIIRIPDSQIVKNGPNSRITGWLPDIRYIPIKNYQKIALFFSYQSKIIP